ncbi:hypothetical protein J4E91_001893 [Alternaria rosae]|nr:hypothetical protein J4E91_001893 [Alternaria rosae]
MVGYWSKTKFLTPEQKAAAIAAKERAAQKAEFDFRARQACSSPAVVQVYRNRNGEMFRIVGNEMGSKSEWIPVEQQLLASGHLWLPAQPKGNAGPYDEWYEYGQNQSDFILVADADIGFNEVNIGMSDESKFFQFREIQVSETPFGKFWEGVMSFSLDPAREFFKISNTDGSIEAHPAPGLAPALASPVVAAPAPARVPQEQYGNAVGDFVGLSDDQLAEIPLYEGDMEVQPSSPPSSSPSSGGPNFLSGSDTSATLSEPPTISPFAGNMPPEWYEQLDFAAFDADMSAKGLEPASLGPYADYFATQPYVTA